jgi:hypothetical protein
VGRRVAADLAPDYPGRVVVAGRSAEKAAQLTVALGQGTRGPPDRRRRPRFGGGIPLRLMNLLRIALLVRNAARRVDLEYASRSGEPMIVRRDTVDAEEVRVRGLRSPFDREPGFATAAPEFRLRYPVCS